MQELMGACVEYTRRTKRRIVFEYALIDRLNNSQQHARQLAALLSSLGVAMADHIIVSGREALSMAGCGLITRERREDRLLTRVANSDGETLIRAELMKKRKEKQT